MIRINQIKLGIFSFSGKEEELFLVREKAAEVLRLKSKDLRKLVIVRRSVDARDRDHIDFVYTVDVRLKDSIAGPGSDNEQRLIRSLRNRNVLFYDQIPLSIPQLREISESSLRPVIAGTGPCGLFAAIVLVRAGLKPLLIERGERIEERVKAVDQFFESGRLRPETNVQFGEGGAGTFSDGKLNTSVKGQESYIRFVLRTFVEFGAQEDILYDAKPHIGTDRLRTVIIRMREYLISMGAEFRYNTKLCGIEKENGSLTAILVSKASGKGDSRPERIVTDRLMLATGHSARDTYRMLHDAGLSMEPKSFAMGVRVSHPQQMVDTALYGAKDLERKQKVLGPAAYKLTHRAENGRSIYSFCMCPGGYIVNSSSGEGQAVVNGMSYADRDGECANSALVVGITPADFPSADVLAGADLQEMLERRSGDLADGSIPFETLGEFRRGDKMPTGAGSFPLAFCGLISPADVRGILPDYMSEAILEGVKAFSRIIPGFDDENTIIAGIESRTSSPVRILRDENYQSNVRGIIPAGEGAGYAGGITSAAADGIRSALKLIESFQTES